MPKMPSVASFEHALVARQAPKNGCFAEDGELLVVAPVRDWPTTERSHRFIGIQSGRESKYGWVSKLSKPLTIWDFVERIGANVGGEAFEDSQMRMLEAVGRLKVGDAVAADFVIRGVEKKAVHLLVHKVIFYAA